MTATPQEPLVYTYSFRLTMNESPPLPSPKLILAQLLKDYFEEAQFSTAIHSQKIE